MKRAPGNLGAAHLLRINSVFVSPQTALSLSNNPRPMCALARWIALRAEA